MTVTAEPWTVKKVLTWTTNRFNEIGISTPRLDAELLIASVLRTDRVGVYLDLPRPLTMEERENIRMLVSRRLKREPVAYILGSKEFYGHTFTVDSRVLIPRPDTETLVEAALARLSPGEVILDVGTGSGAVIVAIGLELSPLELHASDISRDALEVAQENGRRLGCSVSWHVGSLLDPFPGHMFHMIVSNPPYIVPGSALQAEIGYEPEGALFADENGLKVVRQLVTAAPAHLHPGGWLLMEVGDGQAEEVRNMFSHEIWTETVLIDDLAGVHRVCGARRG